MGIPEELRAQLSEWCTECLPEEYRDRRRIGYTTVGDTITILDRRPPAVPELGVVWSSTPLARLRPEGGTGRWVLHLPTVSGERWEPQTPGAADPIVLLDRIRSAVRGAG